MMGFFLFSLGFEPLRNS